LTASLLLLKKLKYQDLFCLVWTVVIGYSFLATKENSQNIFSNELQSNGVYKFYLAFMNSELDYFKIA
jgi:hypothetical protein